MVGETQASITFPSKIIERLDKFLKTDSAKDMGYSSRPTVVVPLLREFLDKHLPIEPKLEEGEISLYDTYDNKIILTDSIKGTILVIIDKNNKLQCYNCKEDPHENRYVDYCLQNENLWKFLKSKKVKIFGQRIKNGNS